MGIIEICNLLKEFINNKNTKSTRFYKKGDFNKNISKDIFEATLRAVFFKTCTMEI